MAVPFCVEGGRAHRGTVQWLLCAYALLQGFGKGQAHSRRMPLGRGSPPFAYIAFAEPSGRTLSAAMPSEIFCMAGGHTGTQSGGSHMCALFDALRQDAGQFPPQCLQGTAERLSPFLWAVRLIPGRKKIPYPVSFGIRHFEKGVNERGISPASRSVPVQTGIHSLRLPGSPEWAVPIWRTYCRGYWQGPANQR